MYAKDGKLYLSPSDGPAARTAEWWFNALEQTANKLNDPQLLRLAIRGQQIVNRTINVLDRKAEPDEPNP